MKIGRLIRVSERWFHLLLHLYPPDFREEMGSAVVEDYLNRAREAFRMQGAPGVAAYGRRR